MKITSGAKIFTKSHGEITISEAIALIRNNEKLEIYGFDKEKEYLDYHEFELIPNGLTSIIEVKVGNDNIFCSKTSEVLLNNKVPVRCDCLIKDTELYTVSEEVINIKDIDDIEYPKVKYVSMITTMMDIFTIKSKCIPKIGDIFMI